MNKNFSKCMMDEYNMIERHASLLHVDSNGITNALLVLNKMTGEGILVNSEGADYARYSAYLPFAKPFLDYELALIADYCVSEGLGNTSDGLWSIAFDEIREHYGIDFSEDHGLKEPLLDMLRARDEVAEIVMTEDEFEIKYTLDYCPPIPVFRDSYSSKRPPKVPLSENEEFKSIRNAVIREALRMDHSSEQTQKDKSDNGEEKHKGGTNHSNKKIYTNINSRVSAVAVTRLFKNVCGIFRDRLDDENRRTIYTNAVDKRIRREDEAKRNAELIYD